MFYRTKRRLMAAILDKKKAKTPFDYRGAEGYSLPEDADECINNSYYFSAHCPKSRESLYCRLGLRSTHCEVWFYYEKDGLTYHLPKMLYEGECPLSVTPADEGWRVCYQGTLVNRAGEEIPAVFSGVFTSSEPAVDFFSHMPSALTAAAMAKEKWNKEFFAEVQKNNQVHYEQTGRLSGSLTLGEGDGAEVIELSLPAVRDHSFGMRDWGYMNNHLWLMAINGEAELNFSMVSYPALSCLEVGNFKNGDRPMAYLQRAEYDRAALLGGEAPSALSMRLYLTDGQVLEVTVHKLSEIAYPFKGGEYCLIEGIAGYFINGKEYRGILEAGFHRDPHRWFNNMDLKGLAK